MATATGGDVGDSAPSRHRPLTGEACADARHDVSVERRSSVVHRPTIRIGQAGVCSVRLVAHDRRTWNPASLGSSCCVLPAEQRRARAADHLRNRARHDAPRRRRRTSAACARRRLARAVRRSAGRPARSRRAHPGLRSRWRSGATTRDVPRSCRRRTRSARYLRAQTLHEPVRTRSLEQLVRYHRYHDRALEIGAGQRRCARGDRRRTATAAFALAPRRRALAGLRRPTAHPGSTSRRSTR